MAQEGNLCSMPPSIFVLSYFYFLPILFLIFTYFFHVFAILFLSLVGPSLP